MTEWFRRYIDILESEQFPDREADAPYTRLSDAGEAYKPGKTQIWYRKSSGNQIDFNYLYQTHSKIGTLAETNPDQVFNMMQSENWDPNDRSRRMLEDMSVEHASMAKGDLIIESGRVHLVTDTGIKTLGGKK